MRQNPKKRAALILVLSLVPLLLTSCQKLGPSALKSGRPNYNIALQETDKQAMLLNIVRLRYNDRPTFLEVSQIFAAPIIEGSGSFSATGIGASDVFTLGTDVRYSQNPVIMYTPVTGEKFSKLLLTPINMRTLTLLLNGGWRDGRIMKTCIQSINGVLNAKKGGGPTPKKAPQYKTFQRIVDTLERLGNSGAMDIGAVDEDEDGEFDEFQMYIDPAVRNTPEVIQLFKDLNLDPDTRSYKLINAVKGGGGDTIAFVTRPVMAVMFFLSQGVEVPELDLAKGVVTITRDEAGNMFDWQNVTRELMTIKSSSTSPSNAFLAVRYRNNWYYIDDSDVDSKQTLFLLQTLFTLQAGELLKASAPILSLPLR